MNPSKPLDNFPLVRTTNPDKMRETLARVYAEPTLRFARGAKTLNARLNECRLQETVLAFGKYGGAVCLDFPAVDSFVHFLSLRGNAEITSKHQTASVTSAAAGVTISPDAGYQANYTPDYEGLLLKFDAAALTRKLVAMTGATINEPLRMSLQSNSKRVASTLRQYVPMLADTLSEAVAPLPSWWVAQTEQLLMVMFLCENQHNYSHLLEGDAPDPAPWQVRKAEEYIEANWRQAITLEDLAEVAGVSAFRLFRAFKKIRGYSPLEFASQVRCKSKGNN